MTVTPELKEKFKILKNFTKTEMKFDDFKNVFNSLNLANFHLSGTYDSDYHDAIRPFTGYVTQYLGECVKQQQSSFSELKQMINLQQLEIYNN